MRFRDYNEWEKEVVLAYLRTLFQLFWYRRNTTEKEKSPWIAFSIGLWIGRLLNTNQNVLPHFCHCYTWIPESFWVTVFHYMVHLSTLLWFMFTKYNKIDFNSHFICILTWLIVMLKVKVKAMPVNMQWSPTGLWDILEHSLSWYCWDVSCTNYQVITGINYIT